MNMPERQPSLEIQNAGKDVLVHDRRAGKIHVLNQTAGMVLRSCDGTTPIDAVAKRLQADNIERAQRDIVHVIGVFTELGLIRA